jgi:porin
MKMKNIVGMAILLIGLSAASQLHAMPYPAPETWGGDLASRPRLTGNWGGLRDDMAKKGVVLDVDVYSMPQAIVGGGKDSGHGGVWGNIIATLNVDTQKMGLWPGGFFKAQTVTSFGHNIMAHTGAMVPANITWLLPTIEKDTGLQELTYTQFLSQNFGILLGKINSLAPTNELHGDYTTGFMNTALLGPLAFALAPLSAYGAGAIYLPSHDVTLAAMVLDANGTIEDSDLGKAFKNGVTAIGSADLKIKPFGLPGHQNLAFLYSNKDRTSLTQDPSNIARLLLTSRFPLLGNPGPLLTRILETHAPGLLVPAVPLNKKHETWAAVYSFEQFLWQPTGDHKRGIGMFFSVGMSDGNPNPIKYSYSLGVVGKGVVPGRPKDDFGIGWARTEFSDDFLPYLRNRFDLGLKREDALEFYYNVAVTPWLNVSPSAQVIFPALDKTMGSGGRFKDVDNIFIIGVRTGIRF